MLPDQRIRRCAEELIKIAGTKRPDLDEISRERRLEIKRLRMRYRRGSKRSNRSASKS